MDQNDFDFEEEKEILEAAEADSLKSLNEDLLPYVEAAKNTLERETKITIRINQRDFQMIRARSLQVGIPFQSLLHLLLHQYAEGKIEIKI